MAKRNGYLDRKKAEIGVYRQAEKDTYIQFMSDMWQITLNDPEIMGKDVFGEKRIAPIGTVMCSLVIIVAFAASAVALPGLF